MLYFANGRRAAQKITEKARDFGIGIGIGVGIENVDPKRRDDTDSDADPEKNTKPELHFHAASGAPLARERLFHESSRLIYGQDRPVQDFAAAGCVFPAGRFPG